jgi:hypoxanthine phosphoribosyltransferase
VIDTGTTLSETRHAVQQLVHSLTQKAANPR